MKLALGTVQFGLAYGVANTQGQVPWPVAAEIVRAAQQAGIDTLDTAIAYGNSEACLGQIGVAPFRVISKLPALPDDVADVSAWVAQHVAGSLARLNKDRLDGLMLHRPADLLGVHGRVLAEALDQVVSRGHAQAVGVSIYDPSELDQIWPVWPPDPVRLAGALVRCRGAGAHPFGVFAGLAVDARGAASGLFYTVAGGAHRLCRMVSHGTGQPAAGLFELCPIVCRRGAGGGRGRSGGATAPDRGGGTATGRHRLVGLGAGRSGPAGAVTLGAALKGWD